MTQPFTRLAAVLAIASTALLASACASPAPESQPLPSESAGAAAPESPAPEPGATPTADAAAGDTPTCDTIISQATADDFDSLGWTALADSFTVGSVALPDGIQCVWGDFSTATDHVQIFGWAAITDAQSKTAEEDLVADGWTREESDHGVYITENRETAVSVDEDGYGLTYLFGDGWVKYADTKQGIVLVEWPQE